MSLKKEKGEDAPIGMALVVVIQGSLSIVQHRTRRSLL